LAEIIDGPVTAKIEGPFVVFLIGMRINRLWRVDAWVPVMRAMAGMIRELEANPDAGLLAHSGVGRTMVQYWRSFDALETYARSPEGRHRAALAAFNRRVAKAGGAVGIWHETYLVEAGAYETIYRYMPPTGLGRAGSLVAARGPQERARNRLGGGPQ